MLFTVNVCVFDRIFNVHQTASLIFFTIGAVSAEAKVEYCSKANERRFIQILADLFLLHWWMISEFDSVLLDQALSSPFLLLKRLLRLVWKAEGSQPLVIFPCQQGLLRCCALGSIISQLFRWSSATKSDRSSSFDPRLTRRASSRR